MEPDIRKLTVIFEEIYHDGHRELSTPLRVAAGIAVIKNPYAGRYEVDLSELAGPLSLRLGELTTEKAAAALGTQATVFGKAALVGEAGEVQHGSSIIHTKPFGDALRAAAKGHALVPAAEKIGGVGSSIDMSLRSAHDVGDLAGSDTAYMFSFEIRVPDGPRADEILVISALADGGRPNSRVGAA